MQLTHLAPSLQPSFTSSPASTQPGIKKLGPHGPRARAHKPKRMQHTRVGGDNIISGHRSSGLGVCTCLPQILVCEPKQQVGRAEQLG